MFLACHALSDYGQTMRPYSFPLFVPATRPDRYAKAAASGTDTVIVDLEDAVNADDKDDARNKASETLAGLDGADVWLRVNGTETPWYEADIAVAVQTGIAGIVLPKAERAEQLTKVRSQLRPGQALIALVESARGVRAAFDLAESCDRLIFGSIDFALDLSCQPTREACLIARSTLVMASRAARIAAPLDGVTSRMDDAALVREDAEHANMLGFGGKLLIHPQQIEPARQGFAPSPEDTAWARKVMSGGRGGEARSVDGEMIDAPLVERARAILERVERLT